MALDLSNFYIGDTIYLTLIMFLSFYGSSLEYYFSNSKTDYNTLDKTAYSYSFNSGSVSKTYYNVPYKEYYYKIKIPTTEAKAKYLLMGYDLSKYSSVSMNIMNTKFERYTLLIIALSCFGFILLVIFILCLENIDLKFVGMRIQIKIILV